jgi:hypothetical protein
LLHGGLPYHPIQCTYRDTVRAGARQAVFELFAEQLDGLSGLQETYGPLYRELLESLATFETGRVLVDGSHQVDSDGIVVQFFRRALEAVQYVCAAWYTEAAALAESVRAGGGRGARSAKNWDVVASGLVDVLFSLVDDAAMEVPVGVLELLLRQYLEKTRVSATARRLASDVVRKGSDRLQVELDKVRAGLLCTPTRPCKANVHD